MFVNKRSYISSANDSEIRGLEEKKFIFVNWTIESNARPIRWDKEKYN